jgi:hypothetical protein
MMRHATDITRARARADERNRNYRHTGGELPILRYNTAVLPGSPRLFRLNSGGADYVAPALGFGLHEGA